MAHAHYVDETVSTGITGLDNVLRGGLPCGHLYLIEGDAGAGKTTLGLQFLMEGKRLGEQTLWVSLSETEAQLRGTAASHGWDLDGIVIFNPARLESGIPDAEYSFFSPADIELSDITKTVVEVVERVRPSRIVFDPFSDVRMLARDPLRYRRQVLQLREFFVHRKCTVLLIQERTAEGMSDPAAEGLVQGIIALYQHAPEFGRQRRRLRVLKLRGVDYRDGFHDTALVTGGLQVYPRLIAHEHMLTKPQEHISTGLPEFDQMLGGGVERGSSVLVLGPAGVGKSTLCNQFALAEARRGEKIAVFLFDETVRAFMSRAQSLGFQLEALVKSKQIMVRQIDPTEFSPGEFGHEVRRLVEEEHVRMLLIDSLNGFLNGMPDERHLSLHLHELLSYLSYQNVLTLLTMNQHGLMGEAVHAPVDISYLADTAVILRYFEAVGVVRRAISVLKRRSGAHETQIREVTISHGGIKIGGVLTQFGGVLSGLTHYIGDISELPLPKSS